MRVIAGKARGTRLAAFKGADIRPTLDRVKESFFNKVGPQLEEVVFLDLFAGTGSMGIEALSRSAEKVVFVESNHRAQGLIYSNLERCHFGGIDSGEKNWILMKSKAMQALHILEERGTYFDIVYVDPPFADDVYTDCLLALSRSRSGGSPARTVREWRPGQAPHDRAAPAASPGSRLPVHCSVCPAP